MTRILQGRRLTAVAAVTFMTVFLPSPSIPHCDTMDGPVVVAAQSALDKGDVNLVLIWVQKEDETVIRDAFRRTLEVRSLNSDARHLADMYFFETVVRIHRAGEGVAYTGLKPAGTGVEEGIEAADKAIASGSEDQLLQHLEESLHRTVSAQFAEVMRKKRFSPADIDGGRAYVTAYVQFIHSIDAIQKAVAPTSEVHLHNKGH